MLFALFFNLVISLQVQMYQYRASLIPSAHWSGVYFVYIFNNDDRGQAW